MPGYEQEKAAYGESKIKTLSSLEYIRLGSGMYIGPLGKGVNPDDGIYIPGFTFLYKEVADNGIDEFIPGYGSRVDIAVQESCVQVRESCVQVRDISCSGNL